MKSLVITQFQLRFWAWKELAIFQCLVIVTLFQHHWLDAMALGYKKDPGIAGDILAIGARRFAFEVVRFTRRVQILLVMLVA